MGRIYSRVVYAALGDSMSIDDYAGGRGRGAASLVWRNRDHDFPDWAGRDLTTTDPGARLVLLASDGATSTTVAGEQLGRVGPPGAQPRMQHLAATGPAGQQRVVAERSGVAVAGTLLGMPVDLHDGGVGVDGHRAVPRPGARSPRAGQHPLDELVELAGVAEGEGAQQRQRALFMLASAHHESSIGGSRLSTNCAAYGVLAICDAFFDHRERRTFPRGLLFRWRSAGGGHPS